MIRVNVDMISYIIILAIVTSISSYSLVTLTTDPINEAYAQAVNASQIYNSKTLDVGNNAKNLIILIPNEGHESPKLPQEQRLINQPYVPENIVVSPGTNLRWFVGDVGHTRTISLVDSASNNVFKSGDIDFNQLSKPLLLNKSGTYKYFERDVNQDDPSFVMEGTIKVQDNNSTSEPKSITASAQPNFNTLTFLMAPSDSIEKQTKTLDNAGIKIVDKYTFKALDDGSNQDILVLGTNEPSLDNVKKALTKVTNSLPYG